MGSEHTDQLVKDSARYKKLSMFKKSVLMTKSNIRLTKLDIKNGATFNKEFTLQTVKEFDRGGGLNDYVSIDCQNILTSKKTGFNRLFYFAPELKKPIQLGSTQTSFDIEWEILKDGTTNEFQKSTICSLINLDDIIKQPDFKID